ncbi:MAG: hypothetical protein ABI619_01535, partial [Betaproteobacteria bacterium]
GTPGGPDCFQSTWTDHEDWPSRVDAVLAMMAMEADGETMEEEDGETGPCAVCMEPNEEDDNEPPPTYNPAPDDVSEAAGFFGMYGTFWVGNLDGLQLWLDGAGCIPGVGEPFDAGNAVISGCRGDWKQAGLSGISIIPIAGDAIGKSGKVGIFIFNRGGKAVGATAGAVKHFDEATDVVSAARSRMRGDRMKWSDSALEQLDEIEAAQRLVRQGKSSQIIDSIEKSKQAAKHELDRLR